jgi:hypothetical protein
MKRVAPVLVLALLLSMSAFIAAASSPVVVSEADVARQVENSLPTNNWVLFTRAGTPSTAGQFVNGPGTPPLGSGSLRLETATGNEKVYLFNYDHIGTPLADIDVIGYSTYRNTGNFSQVSSINIQVDYNGDAPGGFTTLVFEPVYNLAQGAVVNSVWQTWDAFANGTAVWWSSNTIPGAASPNQTSCNPVPCYVTWNTILANNPQAVIVGGFGINQGSGNPNLNANVDALAIGVDGVTTVYDFEYDVNDPVVTVPADIIVPPTSPAGAVVEFEATAEDVEDGALTPVCNPASGSTFPIGTTEVECTATDSGGNTGSATFNVTVLTMPPATQDECKNGGWQTFNNPVFKNQGDCVSSVVSKGKNK